MLKNLNRNNNEEMIDEVNEIVEETENVEEIVEENEQYNEMEDMEVVQNSDLCEEFADEENDEDIVEEDEDKELYIVKKQKIRPKLAEGEHIAKVKKVKVERKLDGKFGKPWVKTDLQFLVKNRITGQYEDISFKANKSLNPKSRLYPIVNGMLGREPEENFNLKELEGKMAVITIKHNADSEGNVWANISAARKYVPKQK